MHQKVQGMITLLKSIALASALFGLLLILSIGLSGADAESFECGPKGWFPTEFGLKDHHVFSYDGHYYVISNYLPNERFFAYARSPDLCNWENLTPVLNQRQSVWDSSAVWAPFVFEENGTFYLFYTGVKGTVPYMTQSIMLATSTDPADPGAWIQQDMIFQPDHENMVWEDNQWADCRDPMVMKIDDTYYLYYTGLDEDGGIIGLATANSPEGPWQDEGSILTINELPIPESATVTPYNGFFYLFYNHLGGQYRVGSSPRGPWSQNYLFMPGWAHEIWYGTDTLMYSSYLTDYQVTISYLNWDNTFSPQRPFMGTDLYQFKMPIVVR
jgi:hypothetical protein